MKREDYTNQDQQDLEAIRQSRTNVLDKGFESFVWCSVINRAIADILYYDRQIKVNPKYIKEEHLIYKRDALRFLFNNNHYFPFDIYSAKYTCPKCNIELIIPADIFFLDEPCPSCNTKINSDNVKYQIINPKKLINLEELLSILGLDNIKVFRKLVVKKIKANRNKYKGE